MKEGFLWPESCQDFVNKRGWGDQVRPHPVTSGNPSQPPFCTRWVLIMYFSTVFIKCVSELYFSTVFPNVFLNCIYQMYFSIVFVVCISQLSGNRSEPAFWYISRWDLIMYIVRPLSCQLLTSIVYWYLSQAQTCSISVTHWFCQNMTSDYNIFFLIIMFISRHIING